MTRFFDLKTKTEIPSVPPFAAALGFFDGVHLGHRTVLREAVSLASSLGVASAAWFFSDSPKSDPVLTDLSEKEELISSLGVAYSVTEEFDSVKDMAPEAFVADYLIPLGCRGIVCGFNFRFGKGASGDVELLRTLCLKYAVPFVAVPPVEVDGEPVSSTKIRRLLAEGDFKSAAALLGDSPLYSSLIIRPGKESDRIAN